MGFYGYVMVCHTKTVHKTNGCIIMFAIYWGKDIFRPCTTVSKSSFSCISDHLGLPQVSFLKAPRIKGLANSPRTRLEKLEHVESGLRIHRVSTGSSIIFTLFLIKLTLLFSSGILVLLVLRDQIVHVGLGLSELHLIHTLTSVPVQESLSAEHGSEVLCHPLEHLLNRSGVARKCNCHLETLWWDVAHGCLDVVWDPLNKVGRVLVLNVQHLFVNLLGGHAASEQGGCRQVAAVTRISSAHHVLGVEHPCDAQ